MTKLEYQAGALQNAGVVSDVWKVAPTPVTTDALSRGLPRDAAAAAVAALAQAGFLDAGGLLREDPRGSDWRRVVAPVMD